MIKQILKTFFPFGLFMQMNILGSLFGGSKSSSKTNPATVFGPQSKFLSQLYPQLTSMFQQEMGDPGSILGFNPNELAGQQGALQAAQGFAPTLNAATQGIQSLFGAADPNSPLTQGAINAAINPLFQNFQDVVAPSIRRAAGGMGRSGDTKATQLASSDLFRQAGDITSRIALGAHQQGLGAVQGGLGQLSNLFGAQMMPSDIQRQIGQQQFQRQNPLSVLDMFRQSAGTPIVLSGGGQTRGSSAKGGIADVIGMGAGMASLFSDKRLKTNIRRIGQYKDYNLYSYDYVWGDFSIGVMADEVEQVNPNAVCIHPSGYKMVNYGEL